jgi:hypothetical protein
MLADAVGLRCRKRIPGIVFTARCIRYFPIFQRYVLPHREDLSREDSLSLSPALALCSACSSWPASPRGQTDSIIPCKKKQVSSCRKCLLSLNISFFFVLALTRTLTRTCAHRRSLAHPRSLERSQTFCLSLSYSLRLGLELSQARTRAIEAHLSLSTLLPQPLLSTNGPRDDLPKNPD